MRKWPAYLLLTGAPLIWAWALMSALRGIEPCASWLYFFAWWPYLLVLEALLFLKEGKFWLLARPREFLRILVWSVTIWLVFEAYNLVLGNWRYAAMLPSWRLRWSIADMLRLGSLISRMRLENFAVSTTLPIRPK